MAERVDRECVCMVKNCKKTILESNAIKIAGKVFCKECGTEYIKGKVLPFLV